MDESLMMAQAMRYEHDLMPWRSVDTTTSGPLNSWAFYLMRWVFGAPSYGLVHALAAVATGTAVLITWLTLRVLCHARVAALGGLAACTFVMLGQSPSMTHFTSEMIPLVLLTAAVWMIALGVNFLQVRHWAWPLAALLAGAAPWAKLQAAPLSLALVIGLMGMICWLRPDGQTSGTTLLRASVIAGAFCTVTLFLGSLIALQGTWDDFWNSYIARNLAYANAHTAGTQFSRVLHLWTDASRLSIISLLMAGMVVFAGAWGCHGCPGWRQQTRGHMAMLACMVLYLAAGVYAVTKPPFNFPHYHFLLFLPVILVSTMLLSMWSEHDAESTSPNSFPAGYAWFALTVIAMPFAAIRSSAPGWLAHWRSSVERVPGYQLARRLQILAPHATSLGIWGWAPQVYVHAGLTPASRHAISHYLIDPHPLRERFRRSYLADLKKSRPAVIVDAVTPLALLWDWSGTERIESFPELDEFIRSNYRLVENFPADGSQAPYRIYLLNDSGL
ncbi:hypothetical protein [Roseimicrobium gellanilyticum]|uniref:hypothetical protein n=1 Tax=Roseimicrobium gellanilyticum TaxID=748857 RepID=UPI001473051D|nr:hypothetical protein [Roseimicrobium gellanilyticum]